MRLRDERPLFGFLVGALKEAVLRTDMATPGETMLDRLRRREGRPQQRETLPDPGPYAGPRTSYDQRDWIPRAPSAPAPTSEGGVAGAPTFGVRDVPGTEESVPIEPASIERASIELGPVDAWAAVDDLRGPYIQVAKTYLLRALPDGFEIIDQHALHERLTFEELRRDVAAGRVVLVEVRNKYDSLKAPVFYTPQQCPPLATAAVVGPEATPEDFPTEASRLAFALNAYNANVLAAVLAHTPIASVHDVRGPLEPTPGFGFFWALKVRIDGRRTNLFDYEHDVVRAFGDARVHAALNCASISCPPLARRPYEASSLDAQLDQAMRQMLTLPAHLRVDDDAIRLSAIFDWFAGDFVAHAKRLGLTPPEGREGDEGWLLAFLLAFTDGELQRSLELGARAGLPLAYAPYDWGLNDVRR